MVDLLDALHYMFEDDLAPSSAEQQEARQKNRTAIYTELYGKSSYDWAVKSDEKRPDDFSTAAPRIGSSSASPDLPELTHKPYIPPTDFNPDATKPFGDALDAPLG